ncbi:tRNA pseudouridine(55) synthase TruB [Oscillospiraceae bacterium LTW-04]|nr:tRNA pseudouridine(55) synthase TruB [Oscillospiraceae bacterium MB24-C1]
MADGILLLDKPQGFTSFDVIAKLRGMSRQRKIGHAGTLDPMATGVLPCLFGSATRLCDIMPCEEKTYFATVQFGISTDTQDITGEVLSTSDLAVDKTMVEAALPAFRGEITQIPPMYSAVSVNGKRLYDLARQGKEVERPGRQITIHDLTLVSFDANQRRADFSVTCSKGSYVRTLFHDIGQVLGCGAALFALRRTASSGFAIDDCITMDEAQHLTDQGTLLDHLLPVSTAFVTLPRLEVGEWQGKMLSNGVALSLKKLGNPEPGQYAVWQSGIFLGLGTVAPDADGMRLKRF